MFPADVADFYQIFLHMKQIIRPSESQLCIKKQEKSIDTIDSLWYFTEVSIVSTPDFFDTYHHYWTCHVKYEEKTCKLHPHDTYLCETICRMNFLWYGNWYSTIYKLSCTIQSHNLKSRTMHITPTIHTTTTMTCCMSHFKYIYIMERQY